MANRYWVGGTASWDGTVGLKWALTSGGVGGQLAPTTSDTVFFDANSGAGTVTLGTTGACSTINFTGFTGTFAWGTNTITVAGNNTAIYTQTTSCTFTGTPVINCTYSGSTGTRGFSLTSITETNSTSINVSAGSDTISVSGNSKSLKTTGFNGIFANTTRTFYGNLTLSTGITINAGTFITTFGATSGTQTITSNAKTMDFPITFAGTATYQLVDALTSGASRTMTLTSGTLDLNNNTLTVGAFSSSNSNTRAILFGTGNITLNGSSGTLWNFSTITGFSLTGTPTVNLTDTGAGTTRTITHTGGIASQAISIYVKAGGATSTVGVGSTGAVFKTIDLTGFSGTFTNSTIYVTGDFVLAAGVTWTSTSSMNLIGTSTQNITSNGNTFDLSITIGQSLTTTGASGTGTTATITFASTTIYPSVGQTIIVRGVTPTGYNGTYTVTASSSTSVSYANSTTGAQTVAGAINIPSNVQLVDAMTVGSTRTLFLGSGTFNSNAKNVTCGAFNANNSNTKTLTLTNTTFTVTNGTSTTGFIVGSTGTTWNVTGSNIVFTTTSVTNFYGGSSSSITYPQVTMSGTGQLIIGNSTNPVSITTLANTVQPCTVSLLSTSGTFTVTNFNLSGTAGNLITFNSSVAGTARTISKSSGTVNAQYLAIQDSTATGGATWRAANSVNNGNNTGWFFDYFQALTSTSSTSVSTINKLLSLFRTLLYAVTSNATINKLLSLFRTLIATNGLSTATFIKAISKTLSYLSSSVSIFIKAISKTISATSISTTTINRLLSLFKTVLASTSSTANLLSIKVKTLALSAVSTSSAVIVKSLLRTLSVLNTSVSTLIKLPIKLLSTSTTSVSSIQKSINKIFATISEITIVVITEIGKHLVSFSVTVSSSVNFKKAISIAIKTTESSVISLFKAIPRTLTATQSSIANVYKKLGKTLSYLSTSVSTIAKALIWAKLLSVTSSTTALIGLFRMKLFAVVSTTKSTINKAMYRILTAISSTIASLLAAVFPRLGAVVRYTFTADFKDRLIELYKERIVEIDLRDRLQKLYKLRIALVNKINNKVSK